VSSAASGERLAGTERRVSDPGHQTGGVHHPQGRIGLPTASALYIAAVLGTGVLVLPGLAADAAGPASILAVAIVFVVSIPLAATFAALAARYPDAGGVATFVRIALGPTAARMTGYWFLFGCGFGAPVVAMLGGEYLSAAIGLEPAWVPVVGIAVFLLTFVLAWIGLRVSGGAQLGLTALLVAVVLLVVLSAGPAADPAHLEPFLPHGWAGVGLAISLFVWAFAGWEAITHWAGEFRNPRRTLPLATAIAVVVVGAAYIALQVATVLVLGTEGHSGVVPLLDLVAVTLPGIGPAIVAAIAVIVVVGVLNVYVPAFANLAASLGRDGDLPRALGKGAAAGEVPRRGLLLTLGMCLGYLVLFFALGLDLDVFVLAHTSSMVAVYLVGTVAAVKLLDRFSVGWWMAVISVVLTAGLVALAGANLLIPAVLAVIALAVTFARRRTASKERVDA